MKNYERVSSETTQSYVCFMFSIACKINLGLVKNNDGNLGGRGGSLALEIRVGGGSTGSRKSRWEGGSKNLAIHRGCVDFFWNNPFVGLVRSELERAGCLSFPA